MDGLIVSLKNQKEAVMPATCVTERQLRVQIDFLAKVLINTFSPVDRKRRYIDRIDTRQLRMVTDDLIIRKRRLMRLGGER